MQWSAVSAVQCSGLEEDIGILCVVCLDLCIRQSVVRRGGEGGAVRVRSGRKHRYAREESLYPKVPKYPPLPSFLLVIPSNIAHLHVHIHTYTQPYMYTRTAIHPSSPSPSLDSPALPGEKLRLRPSVTFRTISILITAAAAPRDSIPLSIQCFISGRRAWLHPCQLTDGY